jgi:signal transduction histidine kinase/CheY-like chemotaxis protein
LLLNPGPPGGAPLLEVFSKRETHPSIQGGIAERRSLKRQHESTIGGDEATDNLDDELQVKRQRTAMGDRVSKSGQPSWVERSSLGVAIATGVFLSGHVGYLEVLRACFEPSENNAADAAVLLKRYLKETSSDLFWRQLLEGLSRLVGAQCTFVSKRMISKEQEAEGGDPPAFGDEGSLLVANAIYWNDDRGTTGFQRDMTYEAHGTPCSFMKYSKTFVIPSSYITVCPANPNQLPIAPESYMAVPLFHQGKCFAHFGVMWDGEGSAKRKLSWNFMELIFYAFEDLVLTRLLALDNPSGNTSTPRSASYSNDNALFLRPYAKSLSHELRTPMQGVVGMLDVMYDAVKKANTWKSNTNHVREVFKSLKEYIEIVQDSSRRAVEAADNVVQAYDMNMQVPQTPDATKEEAPSYFAPQPVHADARPHIFVEGHGLTLPGKRRRSVADESTADRPSAKQRLDELEADRTKSTSPQRRPSADSIYSLDIFRDSAYDHSLNMSPSMNEDSTSTLQHPTSRIREAIRWSLQESLQVGGRPDKMVIVDIENGQRISVNSATAATSDTGKTIEWTVDPLIPITVNIEFPELTKIFGCVFHNAVKFTESPGEIHIHACLSNYSRFILVTVTDTGRGIPETFRPKLFRAFSQQDGSLTRQKEGLGLGLLVARGNARRLGGDIRLVRSEINGTKRGSEFEIQIPTYVSSSSGPHDRESNAGANISSNSPPSDHLRNSHHHYASPHHPYHHHHRSEHSIDSLRSASASPRSMIPDPPSSHPTSAPSAPNELTASPVDIHPNRFIPPLPKSVSNYNMPQPTISEPRRGHSGSEHRPESRPAKKKLSFLIAEDNAINLKILVSMLRRLGHTSLLTAVNGLEAVRTMATLPADKTVDIILMDLWMPHMDGYEATTKILAMDRWRPRSLAATPATDEPGLDKTMTNSASNSIGAPGDSVTASKMSEGVTIMAVSADVTAEALERAAAVGMEGYLTKPFKMNDLERLLNAYEAAKRHTAPSFATISAS